MLRSLHLFYIILVKKTKISTQHIRQYCFSLKFYKFLLFSTDALLNVFVFLKNYSDILLEMKDETVKNYHKYIL